MGARKSRDKWKCKHCKLNIATLSLSGAGENLAHERLCQGLDKAERPLGIPSVCQSIGCTSAPRAMATPGAWKKHYQRVHSITLSDEHNLDWIRAELLAPDIFPDPNMNATFGSYYTKKGVVAAFPDLMELHTKCATDQVTSASHLHRLIREYRDEFEKFSGGAIPLDFHSHVSDITPHAAASAFLRVEKANLGLFPNQTHESLLSPMQRETCSIAMMEGIYGACHGTQAHYAAVYHNRTIATGPQPPLLESTLSNEQLYDQIVQLPKRGVIGVDAECVISHGGYLLEQTKWETLCRACEDAGIFLIVDEALTAIRSGYPFSYMMYGRYKPTFIKFGKGMRVCGLAICPDGVTVSRLNLSPTSIKTWAIDCFDHAHSESVPPGDIIQGLATLRMAAREDWPARARIIGENLRAVLKEVSPGGRIGGLGACIYVSHRVSMRMATAGASAGKTINRWLPFLDLGMEDAENIWALFGPESRELRKRLQKLLPPAPVCPGCSDSFDDGDEGIECKTCYLRLCMYCERSAAGHRHKTRECL